MYKKPKYLPLPKYRKSTYKYPEVPGGTCPHWYSKFACNCLDASTKVCRYQIVKIYQNSTCKYPKVPGSTCPHWYSKFACSCSDASTKVCRYQIVKNILNCNKIPNCKKYTKLRLGVTSEKGFVLKKYLKDYLQVPKSTGKYLLSLINCSVASTKVCTYQIVKKCTKL